MDVSPHESGEYICFNLKDLNSELEKLALTISENQVAAVTDRTDPKSTSSPHRRGRSQQHSPKKAEDFPSPRQRRPLSNETRGDFRRSDEGPGRREEGYRRREENVYGKREDLRGHHGPRASSRICKQSNAEENINEQLDQESYPEEMPRKSPQCKVTFGHTESRSPRSRKPSRGKKAEFCDNEQAFDSVKDTKKYSWNHQKSRGYRESDSEESCVSSRLANKNHPATGKSKPQRDRSRRHFEKREQSDSELSQSSEEIPARSRQRSGSRPGKREDRKRDDRYAGGRSSKSPHSWEKPMKRVSPDETRRKRGKNCLETLSESDSEGSSNSMSEQPQRHQRKTSNRNKLRYSSDESDREQRGKPQHRTSRVDDPPSHRSRDKKDKSKGSNADCDATIDCDCKLDLKLNDHRWSVVDCDCKLDRHDVRRSERGSEDRRHGRSSNGRKDPSSRRRGQKSSSAPPSKQGKYKEATVCLKKNYLMPEEHSLREGFVELEVSSTKLDGHRERKRRKSADSKERRRHKEGHKSHQSKSKQGSSETFLCEDCQKIVVPGCLNAKEMEVALNVLDKHIHQYASGKNQKTDCDEDDRSRTLSKPGRHGTNEDRKKKQGGSNHLEVRITLSKKNLNKKECTD